MYERYKYYKKFSSLFICIFFRTTMLRFEIVQKRNVTIFVFLPTTKTATKHNNFNNNNIGIEWQNNKTNSKCVSFCIEWQVSHSYIFLKVVIYCRSSHWKERVNEIHCWIGNQFQRWFVCIQTNLKETKGLYW